LSNSAPHEIDAVAIAHFGRIELAESELEQVNRKFSLILGAFDVVADVPVSDVLELQAPRQRIDLRVDTLGDSLGQASALGNAPAEHEGHFRVPPVM
jgi:aspartyl/glutamyl-tRNA(Asn/Gln) amidotransferase C subunit